MKFKRNKELSVTARKRLVKGLTKIAELYFNEEYWMFNDGTSDKVNKVSISCGICFALDKLGYNDAYEYMDKLMHETDEDCYGYYVMTPEEWEPRANMCLFLVEYLNDTIKE